MRTRLDPGHAATVELVDTHCHLFMEPLCTNPGAVVQRSRDAGVTRVVVPAYDVASWDAAAGLTRLPGAHAALGLHPWVAWQPLDLERLESLLRSSQAVALGEIGLDFAIERFDRRQQLDVLRRQLLLARRLDLPVILHCRKAFDELTALVREAGPLRGVVHAFSRGPELARQLLELGLYLAFGGAITRPRARRPRRSAQLVPAGRMLLETDAPSIGLEGVAPQDTEPLHVATIAAELAQLRGCSVEQIAEETTRNARSLFGLA